MAKIGDFAIAKLDDGEVPCLVTERNLVNPNEQWFIYWRRNKSGKLIVKCGCLHKGRLKSTGLDLKCISDSEVFESIRDNNTTLNIGGNAKSLKAFKKMMGMS